MAFPNAKTHRVSRRKLGRGQYPNAIPVTVTITGSASTATLTFSRPVVVTGAIPLVVATRTNSTQTVVSSTVVTILQSGTVTGLAFSLAGNAANVTSYQGGKVAGTSGTFS